MTLARNILIGCFGLAAIYACGTDPADHAGRDGGGGGDGGGAEGGKSGEAEGGAAPSPGDLPLGLTRTQTGKITLPDGVDIDLSTCTVQSTADVQPLDASGEFSLTTFDYGAELVMVLTEAGNPLLFGYLDAEHTTIDVTSTATAAVYLAAGIPLLPKTASDIVLDQLPASAKLAPFAEAIGEALVADPEALGADEPNASVVAALPSFESLGAQADVIFSPGVQSGMNWVAASTSTGYLENLYRRRAWAYVQRTAEIDADGAKTPVSPKVDVAEFEVLPAVPLQGSFTGTVTDIFNIAYGNQQTVWGPVVSPQKSGDLAPVALPITDKSAKTEYTITVVGPGATAGVLGDVETRMDARQGEIAVRAYAIELLSPLFTNVLLGSGAFTGGQSTPGACTVSDLANSLIQDLVSQMTADVTASPTLLSQIRSSQWGLAFATFLASGSFWTAIDATVNTSVKAGCLQPMTGPKVRTILTKAMAVMNVVAGGLQIFDSGKVLADTVASDQAVRWIATAVRSKVAVNPQNSPVEVGNPLLLTASVLGIDDLKGYSFRWHVAPGTGGALVQVGGPGMGTDIDCASTPQVNYLAATSGVIDTVSVEAWPGPRCQGDSLGVGSTTVKVVPGGDPSCPARSADVAGAVTVVYAGVTRRSVRCDATLTAGVDLQAILDGPNGREFLEVCRRSDTLGVPVPVDPNCHGGSGGPSFFKPANDQQYNACGGDLVDQFTITAYDPAKPAGGWQGSFSMHLCGQDRPNETIDITGTVNFP